ncbi:MAG: sulfite exporter TauE/SafE family protein, partial [Candidatus Latescibacteria bacterium]|nr:sulfite exporter TauE/SafE family protein [Candidatus Latescibacterota bacterium]
MVDIMGDPYHLAAVFGIGIAAGFINIMAGGGSVLTLGVMMLMGLDAAVANGTNRIGLLVEGISGAAAYRTERFTDLRESFRLAALTLPGAILGSIFAIQVSNLTFQRILALVMIFVLITLFLPKGKEEGDRAGGRRGRVLIYPAMVLVGFYGGFVQAGVGFLIMASLRHLLALDLVRINMHKVYIVLIYTIPVLFVFGLTDNINWPWAAALGLGMALGAWVSVKISVRRGERVIKAILGVAIVLMAAKFLLS